MAPRIPDLNGPNLHPLGEREPGIYGATTLATVEESRPVLPETRDLRPESRPPYHEGVLVDWIHAARRAADPMVINPAGSSFQSIPVLDALRMYDKPIVELHISNIHASNEHHRYSIIPGTATAVICGAGAYGYTLAVRATAQKSGAKPGTQPEAMHTGPA